MMHRVCETLHGYFVLGNEALDLPDARFVRSTSAARIYDANHGACVRTRSARDIARVFARADEVFDGLPYRRFMCDPLTPSDFEAALVLADYEVGAEIQLLLEGELVASPPPTEIRGAEDEADWEVIARLTRLDHEEEARRFGRPVLDPEVTRELVATKRAKGPSLRFWIARAEGTDCAFFSSWPGENGVGKVEDLFTHPDFRRRGIATALIARAVSDARARGAGPVLIGAMSNDTPKRLYAAMGFRPFCVIRSYLKVAG